MKYQSNPIIVEAHEIINVSDAYERSEYKFGCVREKGCRTLSLWNGRWAIATPEMLARFTPSPGDYWVDRQDGYSYLATRASFHSLYSPVASDPPATPAKPCSCGVHPDGFYCARMQNLLHYKEPQYSIQICCHCPCHEAVSPDTAQKAEEPAAKAQTVTVDAKMLKDTANQIARALHALDMLVEKTLAA